MPTDLVQTTKDMKGTSIKFCSDKLSAWSAIHLANLEGHEVGDIGASQVLTIIPDLGCAFTQHRKVYCKGCGRYNGSRSNERIG